MPFSRLSRALVVILLIFVPSLASAATFITGDINTDTRWAADGSPYVIDFLSNPYFPRFLTIAPGATFTIDPGVIVKFGEYNGIKVQGALRALGTEEAPIIFTSLQDDTAGGDTNGDGGDTTPADEQWMHIEFLSGSSGFFDHSIVRYGGAPFIPVPMTGIANYGGTLVIDHTTLTHNGYDGLAQYGGRTTITNSLLSDHVVGINVYGGELSISRSSMSGNETGIDNQTQIIDYDENDNPYVSDPGVAVDARDNWWGAASGPRDRIGNAAGLGNSVYGNVRYSPWLASDPFAPDPCAAPGACASSVLFLPGIEASRLYRPDYAGGTTKLWEPGGDADTRDLFMDESGESIRQDVYTKDVVDEAYGTLNIYKSFLADLAEWKSSDVINDYRAAPYDWRVSLDDILNYGHEMSGDRLYYSGVHAATSTPYIIQELRRLAQSSKTGKVTIVAHSNGGLVAKALIKRLQDTHDPLLDKIDSLIMVAVPQTGTPQAIGALLHGYEQGLPRDWLSLFLTPATARAFVANLPSAYNLLPSADYFTYIDDPVVEFDDSDFLAEFRARYGSKIHDGVQLRNFITDARRLASSSPGALSYPSVGNAALLSHAEAFHTTADAWTPPLGIALHEVAGWGEGTLATIRYYEGKKTVCADLPASTCPYYTTAPILLYEPIEVVEGDGTVLVPSALWTTASTTRKYWVDLRDYDVWWRGNVGRKHADILEIPSLRTLIQNILTNATSTPLDFITTTQPAADASDRRIRFILHSPLNLFATDNLGNVVSSATSTIPGGRWKRYGEVQTLTVPKGVPVTLALDGVASGSFTLDMQEISGDNVVAASSTLSAIPSATSTRATMVLADGTLQSASPLLVDYDGDGDTDFSLRPEVGKEVIFDLTPPEARISFSTSTQKLSIEGIDETSPTTVFTTATSSTVTDEAGNTLQIIFKKLKQSKRELKLEIQALRYNGVSAGMAARNALQYEWSVDKAGNIRELEQEVRADSSEAEAHYSAKKNTTRIEEENEGEDDESEKILPGLIIIGLRTENGIVTIDY